MEAVNGLSEGEKGGPPPPSPLTGCYLLIVIGEPHTKEHKDIILQRVAKGLLSWDVNDCLVDLEKELAIITEQAPEGEEARYGERLIQFASENLVTEVLIHPVVSTLAQCVRNLLSSFTRHRHIIHSGYTFAANGSWILQDGTFSLADFAEAFQETGVQRVIRAYENGISLDIHCSPEGDWTRLPKDPFTKSSKVRVNPNDVLTSGSPSIASFIDYVSPFLIPTDIETLLESSDVVGNIRFSHPTLYVFPGGQGDAALFGINGFNMLLDGGFSRKACFWDFVRHLDRLDSVLLTRLNNSNINGISSVLRRKRQNAVYPQIGHFFCNIQERKALLSPDGDKDKDPLLINLLEEGQEIVTNLRHLNLCPQICYRDSEPINLYHKVGHGTLDMYVLSPAKDSKEVREFMQKWNNNDPKLFANQRNGKEFTFPLPNLVSVCALLVWQPANPEDSITRILYPGSTPQHKIFEGLDKLKHLEFIKHPVCSEKMLTPSASIVTLKKQAKDNVIDKIMQSEQKSQKILTEKPKPPPKTKSENKILENNLKNGDANDLADKQIITEKTVKKSDSTESEKSTSKSLKPKKIIESDLINGKAEDKTKLKPKEEPKTKPEPKKAKSRADSLQRKPKVIEKKASPTTPKKTIEIKMNGDAKDATPKSRPIPKSSPSATPAKSTKDANNRKVVESKKAAPKKDTKPAEKKEAKPERKPISRRPKGSPPAKVPGSPMKKVNGVQKPDSLSRKGKLDKEGTTDSSTVSTPSADQDSILKKDISKLTPEELEHLKAQELADLKEEQEVVKEIEAVFRKGEAQHHVGTDLRKVKDVSIDDKVEPEEYLIIEKEEVVPDDSVDDKDVKEDEMQKLTRDSEESEKQRRPSDGGVVETTQEVIEKIAEVETAEINASLEKAEPLPSKIDEVKEKEIKDRTAEVSKEVSATSPEEKLDVSSEKKTTDRDADEENKEAVAVESQPDEKISGTVESGATTTAPTLPEDERIPLDEIKEDNGDQIIEEKHVKEETKEKEVPVIHLPPKSSDAASKLPPVVGIKLEKQTPMRDLVKTPDEVADLPMHEEVDVGNYEDYQSPYKGTTPTDDQKTSIKPSDVEPKEKPKEDIINVDKPKEDEHVDKLKADVHVDKPKEDVNVDKPKTLKETSPHDEIIPPEKASEEEQPKDIPKVEADGKNIGEIKQIEDEIAEMPKPSDAAKEEMHKAAADEKPKDAQETKSETVLEKSAEIADIKPKSPEIVINEIVEEIDAKIVEEHEEKVADEKASDVPKEKNDLEKDEKIVAVEHLVEKDEIKEIDVKVEEVKEPASKPMEESGIKQQAAEKVVDIKSNETCDKANGAVPEETIKKEGDKIPETKHTEKPSVREETKQDVKDAAESDDQQQIDTDETTEEKEKVEPMEKEKTDTPKTTVASEEREESVSIIVSRETNDNQIIESKDVASHDKSEEIVSKQEEAEEDVEKFDLPEDTTKLSEETKKAIPKTKEELTAMQSDDNKQKHIENKVEIEDKTEEKVPAASATKIDDTKQVDVENVSKIEEGKPAETKEQESVCLIDEKKHVPDQSEKHEEDMYKTEKSDDSNKSEKEVVKLPEIKGDADQSKTEEKGDEQKPSPIKLEHADIKIEDIKEEVIKIEAEPKAPKDTSVDEAKIVKETDDSKDHAESVKQDDVIELVSAKDIKKDEILVVSSVQKPEHAESIIIPPSDSTPESPVSTDKFIQNDFVEKMELGRKSPKEREEDVAKIVASVAEVLKSDAPLEEFEGKLPFTPFPAFAPFTTELRETHITTVESPITDDSKTLKSKDVAPTSIIETAIAEEPPCPKEVTSAFLEEERKISPLHSDYDKEETKVTTLIRDSNELMEATSKIIVDIKSRKSSGEPEIEDSAGTAATDAKEETKEDPGVVHRMLVTASSEDGGEETVICPAGSITFPISAESSGHSSPDLQKLSSKKSSIDQAEADGSQESDKKGSGKSTPDIKHDEADKVSVTSRKSSEDVSVTENKDTVREVVLETKVSVETKTAEIKDQTPDAITSSLDEATKSEIKITEPIVKEASETEMPDQIKDSVIPLHEDITKSETKDVEESIEKKSESEKSQTKDQVLDSATPLLEDTIKSAPKDTEKSIEKKPESEKPEVKDQIKDSATSLHDDTIKITPEDTAESIKKKQESEKSETKDKIVDSSTPLLEDTIKSTPKDIIESKERKPESEKLETKDQIVDSATPLLEDTIEITPKDITESKEKKQVSESKDKIVDSPTLLLEDTIKSTLKDTTESVEKKQESEKLEMKDQDLCSTTIKSDPKDIESPEKKPSESLPTKSTKEEMPVDKGICDKLAAPDLKDDKVVTKIEQDVKVEKTADSRKESLVNGFEDADIKSEPTEHKKEVTSFVEKTEDICTGKEEDANVCKHDDKVEDKSVVDKARHSIKETDKTVVDSSDKDVDGVSDKKEDTEDVKDTVVEIKKDGSPKPQIMEKDQNGTSIKEIVDLSKSEKDLHNKHHGDKISEIKKEEVEKVKLDDIKKTTEGSLENIAKDDVVKEKHEEIHQDDAGKSKENLDTKEHTIKEVETGSDIISNEKSSSAPKLNGDQTSDIKIDVMATEGSKNGVSVKFDSKDGINDFEYYKEQEFEELRRETGADSGIESFNDFGDLEKDSINFKDMQDSESAMINGLVDSYSSSIETVKTDAVLEESAKEIDGVVPLKDVAHLTETISLTADVEKEIVKSDKEQIHLPSTNDQHIENIVADTEKDASKGVKAEEMMHSVADRKESLPKESVIPEKLPSEILKDTKEIVHKEDGKSLEKELIESAANSVEELKVAEEKEHFSGKSTPESAQQKGKIDLSGKSTPESATKDKKSGSTVTSGKSTPDFKGDVLSQTEILKCSTPDSKQQSGKSSPNLLSDKIVSESDVLQASGKTTPDLKESLKDDRSSIVSGKSTPEIKLESLKDHSESTANAASLTSGVSTPEIRDSSKSIIETDFDVLEEKLLCDKEAKSDICPVKDASVAGPSYLLDKETSSSSHLSPSKTSTEDLHLSGKSTPDIAEVEGDKTKRKDLEHEKHISGSSTPPTVPVSPVIMTNNKKSAEISTIAIMKEAEQRSLTPGSDDYDLGGVSSAQSDVGSSGCVSRAPPLLESDRNDSEDDEMPGSPLSVTSQVAHSRSSSHYDFEEDNKFISKNDQMTMSFYGALPDDPTEDRKDLHVADVDFEQAIKEHEEARGETLGKDAPTYLYEITKAKYSTAIAAETEKSHAPQDVMTCSFIGSELPSAGQTGQSTGADKKDPIESWGKPLGLPSPAPPADNKGTPKKERRLPPNVSAKNKLNDDKKRSESPSKFDRKKKVPPVYVDLTYVPHHGNSNYSYIEFFKRIRARYYVFSGIEPSKEVYNALLEAKQTWDDKELEVTIIPTYDTDILGYWVAENEDLLAKHNIDLSPSASRCTINLQDHETSCSAYRLEF